MSERLNWKEHQHKAAYLEIPVRETSWVKYRDVYPETMLLLFLSGLGILVHIDLTGFYQYLRPIAGLEAFEDGVKPLEEG